MTASATLSQGRGWPSGPRPDRRRGDERRSLIFNSTGGKLSSRAPVDRRGPCWGLPVGRCIPAPFHSLSGKADHMVRQFADGFKFRPGRRDISTIARVTLASVQSASRKFGLLTTGRGVRGLIPCVTSPTCVAVPVVFQFLGAIAQALQFCLGKLGDGASAIVLSFHRAGFQFDL